MEILELNNTIKKKTKLSEWDKQQSGKDRENYK